VKNIQSQFIQVSAIPNAGRFDTFS